MSACTLFIHSPPFSLSPSSRRPVTRPWTDMEDSGTNKKLKRTLESPPCEEESKKVEQKTVRENPESPSQSPKKAEVQEPEAPSSPPRTPPSHAWNPDAAQGKGAGSPEPALKTPKSDLRRAVVMPASPDKRSHLPCGSPFMPKVSGWQGRGDMGPPQYVPVAPVTQREDLFMCIGEMLAGSVGLGRTPSLPLSPHSSEQEPKL